MYDPVEYQMPYKVPSQPLTRTDETRLNGNGSRDYLTGACWPFFIMRIVVPTDRPRTMLSSEWSRFQMLRQRWHQERGATSSITQMGNCPAYQSIIGMGPSVIPHILRQLESEGEEPDMWFWALKALTEGYDPVPDSNRGDFRAMAAAWLAWGHRRYAW